MKIMAAVKLATLFLLALLPFSSGKAAEVTEAPEEIIVTGRLPGPPLWKVSNGDKVMWIFPLPMWTPKDMLWDSERVARVIAESQEALVVLEVSGGPAASVMLNPINVLRAVRLSGRLQRNPDGGTLDENLPPELFARFAALHARYFPQNDAILEMRPLNASEMMMNIIHREEGLDTGGDIVKTIRRLVRRNGDIKHTEISLRVTTADSYREWADGSEAWVESLPREQEQACFEQRVRHMEEDLDQIKSLAHSWAQGDIDEFRNDERYYVSLAFDRLEACEDLLTGNASTEQEIRVDVVARAKQMWLDAVENALATNASTFAILPITELLAEDGLLSKLKAKGYEVREP
jgi:hypothetical protein